MILAMTIAIPVWSIWLAGGVAYLTCSVLGYGFTLAYYQRQFADLAEEGYWSDRVFAALIAISGPLGLCVVLLSNHGSHGFMFRSPHPQEPRAFLKPQKK